MTTTHKVRAKVWCSGVTHHHTTEAGAVCATIELRACYGTYPGGDSEENKSFSKWTPTLDLKMSVTNPDAIAQFHPGAVFYLDFIPIE